MFDDQKWEKYLQLIRVPIFASEKWDEMNYDLVCVFVIWDKWKLIKILNSFDGPQAATRRQCRMQINWNFIRPSSQKRSSHLLRHKLKIEIFSQLTQ